MWVKCRGIRLRGEASFRPSAALNLFRMVHSISLNYWSRAEVVCSAKSLLICTLQRIWVKGPGLTTGSWYSLSFFLIDCRPNWADAAWHFVLLRQTGLETLDGYNEMWQIVRFLCQNYSFKRMVSIIVLDKYRAEPLCIFKCVAINGYVVHPHPREPQRTRNKFGPQVHSSVFINFFIGNSSSPITARWTCT